MRMVEEEKLGPDSPPPGYINGDTPLYEQLSRQEGVFNRLLVYRRNSLHSGAPGDRISSPTRIPVPAGFPSTASWPEIGPLLGVPHPDAA